MQILNDRTITWLFEGIWFICGPSSVICARAERNHYHHPQQKNQHFQNAVTSSDSFWNYHYHYRLSARAFSIGQFVNLVLNCDDVHFYFAMYRSAILCIGGTCISFIWRCAFEDGVGTPILGRGTSLYLLIAIINDLVSWSQLVIYRMPGQKKGLNHSKWTNNRRKVRKKTF